MKGRGDQVGRSTKPDCFEWDVRSYVIKLRSGEQRVLLDNIVGSAQSGTFTAVVGPSGCGKTSLLDCLSLRNRTFNGAIRLNDQPVNGSFFRTTGYVPQTEMFMSHLSPREHLTFHSINRMSGDWTKQQCYDRVEEVLEEVDLRKVADSEIGGGAVYLSKGLSGGERKRLNIATELLSNPSILFLDEPTSGLDAVMCEMICIILKQLAVTAPKRIVMAAVHSPSSKVFTMFTHLLVLTSNSQLAYYGPAAKMLSYLEGLGFSCPSNYNPADFMLELASAKVLNLEAVSNETELVKSDDELPTVDDVESGSAASIWSDTQSLEAESKRPLHGEDVLLKSEAHLVLVKACKQRQLGSYNRLDNDLSKRLALSVAGSRSSFFTQFRTNLWRSWLQQRREVTGNTVGLMFNIALGLIFGILYLNKLQGSWRNTAGFLLALNATLLTSASLQVTIHMPADFGILLREYYSGCNNAVPYFLGRSLAAMPFSLIYMGMAVVSYWLTGLVRTLPVFLNFCATSWLLIFGAQSLGYLSSAFSSNHVIGLALAPLMTAPMFLFCGMLYERETVPAYLRWMEDLSLVNYSFASYVINEASATSDRATASQLLGFLQVRREDWSKYMLLLFVLGLAYRFLAMVMLTLRVRNVKPI